MIGRQGEMSALYARQGAHDRDSANRAAAPDVCRCHRPLVTPDGPHWWPDRDPEPAEEVRVVAVYGEDPGFLRRERVPAGWRTFGSGACYAESSPPRQWDELGGCWAGTRHPVVDVSGWESVSESAEQLAHQQQH